DFKADEVLVAPDHALTNQPAGQNRTDAVGGTIESGFNLAVNHEHQFALIGDKLDGCFTNAIINEDDFGSAEAGDFGFNHDLPSGASGQFAGRAMAGMSSSFDVSALGLWGYRLRECQN